MPLNIIRNDISKVSADAIVNTANPMVAIGYGVDQAIYEAAGAEQLLAERAKIGAMSPGQAAATPAFALDAKYIIHTVGPVWEGGDCGEREAVASCYRESLRIAKELQCESVAFPLISTGSYGFPKDEALQIAIREISSFLFSHDMTVYMVVYDKNAFVISTKAFGDVKSYIEEQDVKPPAASSYGRTVNTSLSRRERNVSWKKAPDAGTGFPHAAKECSYSEAASRDDEELKKVIKERAEKRKSILAKHREKKKAEESKASEEEATWSAGFIDEFVGESDLYVPETDAFEEMPDSLEEAVHQQAETFQQMLFRIIDRKGMTDPEVYKKANLDRKLFSKIRSNENYVPSKRTALAFAVALELNLDETVDLLRRAGLALSPSSRSDRIVEYCINNKIYDIFEINTYLFDYDEPLLVG